MLKQLTLKKEYYLIVATIALLFICYQLAIKRTIQAWQINEQLKRQITQASDLSYQPAYLERKNSNLDKIINRYKVDTADIRSSIISIIASIAEKENVKLSEVPIQDALYHTDRFIIQRLNFEGDFFSITKVLNRLQFTNGIGIVRAASYKSIVVGHNSNELRKLMLEVYLVGN